MKISFIAFVLAGMLSLSALEWPLAEVTVEAAKPNDTIQKLAREEMVKHLRLIAGERKPGKQFKFIIGRPAPGQEGRLERTETRYAVRGNTVYFWGDDHFVESIVGNNTRCGTLFAVYAFLENELGVRWIRPTDRGIVYDNRSTLSLPENKDYQWVMPLEMTGVRVYWWRNRLIQPHNAATPEKLRMTEVEVDARQAEDHLWFRRMRHGKRVAFPYGHAFVGWWNKYGKDHPEYFGLDVNGKRGLSERLRGREKLCLTNPEVIDVIIREWEENGKPEYLNICPNDGTPGFCRCDNCMALDTRLPGEDFLAHLTDRYVWFWNKVAARAVKLRPDVKLATYVYSYYRHPPRREKIEYPDNMLLGMVPAMFEDNNAFFSAWEKVGAKNVFLRPNDLTAGMPLNRGLEKRIYDKFKASTRFKIFGTDYDGTCGNRNIDMEYYIAARMMHDQNKTFEELENEYCSAYGAAADDVREYYRFWRKVGEVSLDKVDAYLKKENQRLNDSGQIAMVLKRNIGYFIGEEEFAKGAAILQGGAKKQLSPRAKSLLDELIVIDQHSCLTWRFVNAINLKKENKPNQLETISRELVSYREQNRDLIGWNWPSLFTHGRSEGNLWPLVDWYRQEVLKTEPAPTKVDPNLVFSHNFDNNQLNGWKKRPAFKQIAPRAEGGYCLEFIAKENNEIGASLSTKVTPGRYKLSAEIRLQDKAEFMRFRIVGGKQTLLNLVEKRKDDQWQTVAREFNVPAGVDNLTIYAITGPGGPAYLDNIQLIRIDEGAADAL